MKLFYLCLATIVMTTGLIAAEPAVPSLSAVTPVSFQIRNKKFGELLRPEDANGATGTRIVLYPGQPWKCMTWKLNPVDESTFQLQNHFTSKTFAVDTKTDKAITQVPYTEGARTPAWKITKLPDGTSKIIDPKSGRALTAVKEGSGLKIVIQPWVDTDEQKWELIQIDPKTLTM